MKKLVIIGNGIAGTTLARWVRKLSDFEIEMISDESPLFYSRTALMYIFMGDVKLQDTYGYPEAFFEKNNIKLIHARAEHIDTAQKTILLKKEGANFETSYDYLVIATGSKPTFYNWPNQNAKGVQGFYHLDDLQELEKNAKHAKNAVLVGGGLIGIELAEMLQRRAINTHFLIREKWYWNGVLPDCDAQLLTSYIAEECPGLALETSLDKIEVNAQNEVIGVTTTTGESIACDLVGIATGVHPNIDWLKETSIETDKGVLIDAHFETNIKDIFAIGDCAQHKMPPKDRRNVEAVWYTGRIMGETLARHLCLEPSVYAPGPWFNSAKFFELEYQTYGLVSSDRMKKKNEIHFQCVLDSTNHKWITIALDRNNNTFLGINSFGIRWRHEVFEQWLIEKKTSDFIVNNMTKALFDPEFFKDYSQDIQTAYNRYKDEKNI